MKTSRSADRQGRGPQFHEIDHPAIAKAAGDFPAADHEARRTTISSVSTHKMYRLKTGRWRGAVWIDDDGQAWLVAVGYREDGSSADFYEAFATDFASDPTRFMPTEHDHKRLERETAETGFAAWERGLQELARAMMDQAERAGMASEVVQAVDGRDLMQVLVSLDRLSDYPAEDGEPDEDDFAALYVEVNVLDYTRYDLIRWAEPVILTAIYPHETAWDAAPVRSGSSFSLTLTAAEAEHLLVDLHEPRAPGISIPTATSHYAHREGLTQSTVVGDAVFALCGACFVPRQDHESLPVCRLCEAIHRLLGDD
jgi:hypothetical protein